MDTGPLLAASVKKVLGEVVLAPVVVQEELCWEKFRKPRIRAQAIVDIPHNITIEEKEGEMVPLMDVEVQHAAAVIAAAFLNPVSTGWDYDRFSDSPGKREISGKYFADVPLGFIAKPTTVVDIHGKILMWYLPGLLLPHRVEELNRVTKCLKIPLCSSAKKGETRSSWRSKGFTRDEESIFGAGRISLSVGSFQQRKERLKDSIHISPPIRTKTISQWLQSIDPAEQLFNAVLQIVHPDMWSANSRTTRLLVEELDPPLLTTWPAVYPGMDIIANRVTPRHCDKGGAPSFYDHLVSFGLDHDARFLLNDLHAEFAYKSGTSVLFPGKDLYHEVQEWSGGERLVIAHYAKDIVQERLKVARPLLPTQLGWWSEHTVAK